MKMKTITNEVIKEIEELKELMFGLMGTESVFMDIDETTLKTMQLCMRMIDDSCNLMKEYVDVLDEQNHKLDMILKKLDEEKA